MGAHGVARADDRRCELDPDTGQLKCVLVAQPSPPLSVRLSVELPLVWKRLPFNDWEMVARGHGCTRSTADVTEIGVGYVVTLINTATLEQLYLDYVCEWPGGEPPEPPPPPPTQAELVQANTQALQVGAHGEPAGFDRWAHRPRLLVLVRRPRRSGNGSVPPWLDGVGRRRGRAVGLGGRWPGRHGGHQHVVRLRGSPLGLLDARDERRIRGHVDRCVGGHLGSHVERHPDGVVPAGSDQPDRASRRRTPSTSTEGS